ncbi:MAG TPA: hypothetical protein VK304_08340 [Thermoleophilaceae bacterium]|nr:hypothetical protein [Thermoleophilaceae bacterium]
MRRALILLSVCALAGCGPSSGSSGPTVDPNDKRAVALSCMKEKRIDARPEGKDVIQVGDRRTGPRIQFYLSTGAAETTQFKGEAQGAEQIENALMYVRQGDDRLLEELETCVADAV